MFQFYGILGPNLHNVACEENVAFYFVGVLIAKINHSYNPEA